MIDGCGCPASAGAETPIDTPLGTLHVTFSAGVAQLPPGGTADDVLRLADEALYRAKGAGRNRIMRSVPAPADACLVDG